MSEFINYSCSQIARVMNIGDKTHSGQMQVWLAESGTNPNDPKNWTWVKCGSAQTFGNTPGGNPDAIDSAKDAPRTYGGINVPRTGSHVKVDFMNGSPDKGFWTSSLVYDVGQTKMLPGSPGTPEKHNYDASHPTDPRGRAVDPEFKAKQIESGFGNCPIRGEGSASTHRDEVPVVYGNTTPGGTQFIMDDKKDNAMVRIRMKSGTQLMLNESTGDIFMTTGDGKSWVELTKDGNIDLFSALSVNIRSHQNLNLTADESIQIKCKNYSLNVSESNNINCKDYSINTEGKYDHLSVGDIKIKSNGLISSGAEGTHSLWSEGDLYISSDQDINIKAGTVLREQGASVTIKGNIKTSKIDGVITKAVAISDGNPDPGNASQKRPIAKPSATQPPSRVPSHGPSPTFNTGSAQK